MKMLEKISSKLISAEDWKSIRETYAYKKVVFTNGCFDILHRGHATYLAQARELGDCLIVGLNSDASVKRLKGNSRPVNNEKDRALLLSSLLVVDYVIVFEEDTPCNLISAVLPDVLVKGGDYTLDTIVGADVVLHNGGSVQTIPFVEGYSTTNTIAKLS
ncbi:MAG: D-glycero-beta-D-manno-heptose 1-phosphate adenylyltransferase [Bacteroidales bacterium]|nr:D-glycero-beta-D-manno-heptose 1-phosphate adenylyltransferase [Bacteroidales bacterium]